MRDFLPAMPSLGAVPLLATRPASLVDVPGLVADVERRFAALEDYCAAVRTVPAHDPEFRRLDDKVSEAVEALAEALPHDVAGLVAKARAVTACPAIEEDGDRFERVAKSLILDVVRLLGTSAPS